ncbi:MAG: pyruvate, phosphate dikinase, partial [Firmicutes bacterium]|nr:pyruvate, phosphate dikinase [Bacillota bacterium]
VFMFEEGNETQKELLGGKGANLAGMVNLGLPIPPGFTVSTEACTQYYSDNKKINAAIEKEIFDCLAKLETKMKKKFGDVNDPLLVSVRSGSRASMPGMMDTILNLGLNDQSVEGLAKKANNPRFAYDSYRRFIQMYSDVVMEVGKKYFEELIDEMKHKKGIKEDLELTTEDLQELCRQFKAEYKNKLGKEFPQDPKEQLLGATMAVFRSWNNERAEIYRRMHSIPYDWGTAVNIQAMVFGNKGDTSGTGVAFSRNPATGEKMLYGEYLMNAQGEDVVAGIRTPNPISQLEAQNPAIYKKFTDIVAKLEKHYKDMQDMEFTIEEGELYMLQTRNGKRTAAAALKIAIDLVKEKLRTEEDAICMIDPKLLDGLLHPQFEKKALADAKPIAKGLAASPGAAAGKVVFTAERAVEWKEKGEKDLILVRLETSPEDIAGMDVAQGILTARGGMTSHAAVVARGMGTCCVAGCGELVIDEKANTATLAGKVYKEGDLMSLDGSTGKIYDGLLPRVDAELTGDFGTIMAWADKYRALKIRTNADSPRDTKKAVEFGAEGIGLCRTEHMFFDFEGERRTIVVREMIVAKTKEDREKALTKLLPMQRNDFIGIYKALEGRPATIRFLDPPLHEFVPHTEEGIAELAKELGLDAKDVKATIDGLHEFNPMMGHRGCRLSITYPEIAVMQTKAVIEAAIEVNKSAKTAVVPEIMIPLVGEYKEYKYLKDIVVKTADECIAASGAKLKYLVGTMIEIPRACLTADEIAKEAEFFSFGTNDLTQMTFGFSRDDAAKFLEYYYDTKIYENDPFATIDFTGVGELMKMAVSKARATRKDIKLGICGEHGGDPVSVMFCHDIGLEYVSCSPFRVPIARLAAAQANIKNPRKVK